MASDYTGNPVPSRPPSPAPGPGVIPHVSLPSDGDPASAATVAQGFEVSADFLAHIQSAVRLDLPLVAASGSGFTALIINTTGGSVTPSGSVKIATGTRFVIQIQTGGPVGTATFKTSIDGGNTYGALQTTSASMTDATSGIALAFSGTFTALGVAFFRSAYTPQAQWQDTAGNLRYLIDHNGLPTGGRISQFREEWRYTQNSTSTPGALAVTGGVWQLGTANGAVVIPAVVGTFPATFANLSNGGTSGNKEYLSTFNVVLGYSTTTAMVCEFEAAFSTNQLSSADTYIGLGFDSVDLSAATLYAYFKHSGGGNWSAISAGSAGGGSTSTIVSLAASPTVHRFRIELYGTATPEAGIARFFINDILIATHTVHYNSAPTPLAGVGFETVATATIASQNIFVGPMVITWNRWASSPAL